MTATDSEEDVWVETVWAGTLAVYTDPDIQRLCLSLQDDDGLCVPSLFCLGFAAAAGMIGAPDHAARLIDGEAPRREEIERIRVDRRAARPRPSDPPERRETYEALKRQELTAERALMDSLSRSFHREAAGDGCSMALETTVLAVLAPTSGTLADRLRPLLSAITRNT